MQYLSTRGHAERKPFCAILLEGLAPDGGLYLPAHYPRIDDAALTRLRRAYHTQGYAELAFQILSLYIDDIPPADLHALCAKTYTAEVFGSGKIAELRHLEDGLWIQALSQGPTLAFKDMAMQLLGNLFEYELGRRGEQLNVLGATSGDTGSAAEYALRGKKGVRVFMTSPHGRMSAFQQAQMFSLQDENIHNIAIEGVFDDCQDIVKAVSGDLDFKRRYRIGAVNSINWARLLAQVVYYFAGYIQATESNAQPVRFAVPSGNFGNVCAGHVARMMGLPIAQLVVATNENDVLDEFLRTGVYRVRSAADTHETSSPSMDISKASNFERFVFDLLGRDGARVAALFGTALARAGRFDLSADAHFAEAAARYGLASGKSTHADRLETIRDTYRRHGVTLDPHTADGVKVARAHHGEATLPMIVLETALPIKFSETIVEALGHAPERPAQFVGIEDLPRRVQRLPADVQQVRAYIERHCAPSA
ncbi:threonine synthase [Verminephrobacter aporrectodeae]|uniref:Threonine synthase n=1 Tax=Verminephrobacter aporrectodeae subsp. tuberculatae TaxID=1110392 RepID=A0ABT3KWG4_9BURK|nr:threonine synthase [Verminephrobacter aporrectodeae]MCW5322342.1 threonine synthase [Verminephrobacter aporrectodeae subsp. tuberculatae]MCW8176372.1 threonine synthase [Verminephrobacter aporrectodeae subsp. tuberculatae]MCW8202722.1 threonine synthase [Verminephrobacter aporrectodeae subsp. tuberculatae]MCW8207849.1 threonine synthase [Verminephrobacter aporrectodeae subsp. tuberculatae]